MRGFRFSSTDTEVENPIFFPEHPNQASLLGLWYPGTDAAASIVNHKVGGGAASVVAGADSITYHSGFATFAGNPNTNHLVTPVLNNQTLGIMVVARANEEVVGLPKLRNLAGRYNSGTNGLSLLQDRAYAALGSGNPALASIAVPAAPQISFGALGVSYDPDADLLTTHVKLGDTIFENQTSCVLVPSTFANLIGGNLTTLGNGNPSVSIAVAAFYDEPLTATTFGYAALYEGQRLLDTYDIEII